MAARHFTIFIAGRIFLSVYNDCILGKFNFFHGFFLLLLCGLLLFGMIVGRFGLLCILGGRFVGRFGMIVGLSLLLLLLLFNPGNGGLFRLKPAFIAQLLAILQNVPGIITILFIYDGIRGQAGRLLGGLACLVAGKPCGLLATSSINCAAGFNICAVCAIHCSPSFSSNQI